ncbi:MAG: NUDIX hydrolase, partial [Gammaproteobacteria bacterium]
CVLTAGEVRSLGSIRQSGGKVVHAFALGGDLDPETISSNTFTMEWPPRSGRQQEFPEVDRAGWFSLDEAREKVHKGQVALIQRLEAMRDEI